MAEHVAVAVTDGSNSAGRGSIIANIVGHLTEFPAGHANNPNPTDVTFKRNWQKEARFDATNTQFLRL